MTGAGQAASVHRPMRSRPRVLIVHQDAAISGSAISLEHLLRGIDPARFDVQVLLAGHGPLEARLRAAGFPVEVHPIQGFWTAPGPKWYRKGGYRNMRALLPDRALDASLSRLAPDLVHLDDKALIAAGLSARRVGLRVIQHLRSTYRATNTPAFAVLSRELIRYYATALIGISQDELSEIEGVPGEVIHNSMRFDGLDEARAARPRVRAELGVADDERLVTFVGLFSRTKGAWDFIEMAGLLRRRPEAARVRLMMVGSLPEPSPRRGLARVLDWGSENDAGAILRAALARQGLDREMILPGYRSDILAVMAASDVVVLANRLGAMGRQAFECMAVGTPLVVTAGHSGRSRVAIDRETALVVSVDDHPRMAAAVAELLRDPALGARLSARAQAHARAEFDEQKNGERVMALYDRLLGARQPS